MTMLDHINNARSIYYSANFGFGSSSIASELYTHGWLHFRNSLLIFVNYYDDAAAFFGQSAFNMAGFKLCFGLAPITVGLYFILYGSALRALRDNHGQFQAKGLSKLAHIETVRSPFFVTQRPGAERGSYTNVRSDAWTCFLSGLTSLVCSFYAYALFFVVVEYLVMLCTTALYKIPRLISNPLRARFGGLFLVDPFRPPQDEAESAALLEEKKDRERLKAAFEQNMSLVRVLVFLCVDYHPFAKQLSLSTDKDHEAVLFAFRVAQVIFAPLFWPLSFIGFGIQVLLWHWEHSSRNDHEFVRPVTWFGYYDSSLPTELAKHWQWNKAFITLPSGAAAPSQMSENQPMIAAPLTNNNNNSSNSSGNKSRRYHKSAMVEDLESA